MTDNGRGGQTDETVRVREVSKRWGKERKGLKGEENCMRPHRKLREGKLRQRDSRGQIAPQRPC